MEEETWDETLMGPMEGDDMRVLRTGDTTVDANPALLRKQSSSGGASVPPMTMFLQAIQSAPISSTQQVAAAETSSDSGSVRSSMRFEDEDDEESYRKPNVDPGRIRQEALRMLEVADDQLADSSYAVYRTSTGGFMAAPKDPIAAKRTPSSLSGFSFASSRKNLARPFRDDPYADTEAPAPAPTQEDYEYGEDNAVVDVARMENRSAASREGQGSNNSNNNNWSARYSIDTTLLALSGGGVSSSKLLDKMDKESSEQARRSARNMFVTSPSETRSPQVFGSGFSFRQKHVFGQQNVVVPHKEEPNLNTAFTDSRQEEEAILPARSWQEQLNQKRRNRRYVFLAIGVFLVVMTIVVFSIIRAASQPKSQPATASSSSSLPTTQRTPETPAAGDKDEDPSVTFYVTSDVPLTADREKTFKSDLQSMSKVAAFLAHLGDTQLVETTDCSKNHYNSVSNILKTSPIPVFIIPGEDDWPNCPDQSAAWTNWQASFSEFEQYFDHNFDVLRYDELKENYAFLHKNVLFVGVHETNGRIDDMAELNIRNRKNVQWIKASFEYHKTNMRAMVIFSNGRPALTENDSFYLGLGRFLFQNKMPTAFVHANHENGDSLTYKPYTYGGMDHVIAIQTTLGQKNAPLRINVGFDEINPFIVG